MWRVGKIEVRGKIYELGFRLLVAGIRRSNGVLGGKIEVRGKINELGFKLLVAGISRSNGVLGW